MSYILEALRRSQAERERGHVPGLHAQPVAADATDDAQRSAPAAWLLWSLGGAGLLALVALLLWWTRPSPVVVLAMAPAAPAAATAAPPVSAAPIALPAPNPSDPVAAAPARSLPIVVSAPPMAPVPALPAATAQPSTAAPNTPPGASTGIPPGITPVIAAQRSARVLTVAELSPDQRRDLPPLVLGGSVWSDNVASRFVIFNGQIVHEGQPAAPGVVVERIAAKAVQLRWRGLLFEVAL